MTYEAILYDLADGIATITLNRPDKLNAWTRQMEQEVREAMGDANGRAEVRAIILTGAGRGFCAGADMDLLSGIQSGGEDDDRRNSPSDTPPAGGVDDGLDLSGDFALRYSYFPTVAKPIIAAINGPCAGLGFVMALYADIRFASSQAKFTTAFARRGLIAEHGISWMLPHLVGLSNALDMLLSARVFSAQEAERLGLVSRVIEAEKFMDEVRAYASDLVQNVSPRSMRVMKEQLYNAQFQTLAEATLKANGEMLKSFESEDFKEGVAHFVEKRQAHFSGR